MQHYSQMVSGGNTSQPNTSSPGALPGPDHGVRVHAGTGIGLVGVSRSMPIARPGFQGISTSSIVNSGSMVSPVMSPANMHSGVGSGQGAMLRPRETLHTMRVCYLFKCSLYFWSFGNWPLFSGSYGKI